MIKHLIEIVVKIKSMGNVVKTRKSDMDEVGCGEGISFAPPEETNVDADGFSTASANDIEEFVEHLEERSVNSGRGHVEVETREEVNEEENGSQEFRFDYFVIGGGSGGDEKRQVFNFFLNNL